MAYEHMMKSVYKPLCASWHVLVWFIYKTVCCAVWSSFIILSNHFWFTNCFTIVQWDGFTHSVAVDDDDDGDYHDNEIVMIKSNEFELLAVGAAIATVTVVLLLATCIILVLYMNRFIGVTFAYEIEQLKCGPPAIETVRRTGVEDVPCCQVESMYVCSM